MARSWSVASSVLLPERARQTADQNHHGKLFVLPCGTPEKILVTLLCPIGDTLLATPALHALRQRFPQARITALTYRSNAGILEGNRDLDELVRVNPAGTGLAWARSAKVLAGLHRQDFALVLHFSVLGQVLTAGTGARQVGFPMPPHWWWRRKPDQAFMASHAIDRYLAVVRPVGAPMPQDALERVPRLALSNADRKKARAMLREQQIMLGDVVITLHPGGEGFQGRKQWAPERFAAVARQLIERYNAKIILVGGPADTPLAQRIAAQLPVAPVIAVGKTTLKETAALIEASTLFIGNDSAPLHMAAAVGTAAIGIFGPTNIAQFHPVGRPGFRFMAAHSNLPCSPCFHFVGNRAPWQVNLCRSRACLRAISANEVMAAASQLLESV